MLGRDVVLAATNAGHEVSALAHTDLDVTDQGAVAELNDLAVGVLVPRSNTRDARPVDGQVSVIVEKIGLCRVAAKWVRNRREYPRPEQLHSPIVVGISSSGSSGAMSFSNTIA